MAKKNTTTPVETLEVEKQEVTITVEEAVIPEVEKVEEVVEVKPVREEKKKEEVKEASTKVAVVKIVQKTPSGYRLLLETGEIVRVSKKEYTKGQEFIEL